jgi:hypothetical protein
LDTLTEPIGSDRKRGAVSLLRPLRRGPAE